MSIYKDVYVRERMCVKDRFQIRSPSSKQQTGRLCTQALPLPPRSGRVSGRRRRGRSGGLCRVVVLCTQDRQAALAPRRQEHKKLQDEKLKQIIRATNPHPAVWIRHVGAHPNPQTQKCSTNGNPSTRATVRVPKVCKPAGSPHLEKCGHAVFVRARRTQRRQRAAKRVFGKLPQSSKPHFRKQQPACQDGVRPACAAARRDLRGKAKPGSGGVGGRRRGRRKVHEACAQRGCGCVGVKWCRERGGAKDVWARNGLHRCGTLQELVAAPVAASTRYAVVSPGSVVGCSFTAPPCSTPPTPPTPPPALGRSGSGRGASAQS
eukprot:352688-Chlamydomonas_euryale.AAC.1